MNIVFTALTLISLVLMTFTSPSAALPTMIEGVRNAILLTLKLTAIYAVWLSVLKMMEATGLDKKLSRGLRPVIKRLFKGESEESYNYISVNLASNMLGMGGATTPAGINAMASMCKEEDKASDNMLLLLVINATSIQIFPATVIALRAAANSSNAASVFLPTLIATTVATLIGVILCKLFSHKSSSEDKRVLSSASSCAATVATATPVTTIQPAVPVNPACGKTLHKPHRAAKKARAAENKKAVKTSKAVRT